MGADNWRECPKCRLNFKDARKTAIDLAKKQYGKIPADEYEELLLAAKETEPTEPEQTLREDYSQGMGEDGVYRVGYYCSCDICKLKWKYEHEEKVV